MKTRNDIYQNEAASLLRALTTYHAITLEQALKMFPKSEGTMKALVHNLIKQKRIYLDEEQNLLCDRPESAVSPDYGMIAALWVLLDFKKSILYHASSDFPVKITFFAQDDIYEIIHVVPNQEALINHVFSTRHDDNVNRLVILEDQAQATNLHIPNTIAFCIVDAGTVSYYRKGTISHEQN